jgi:4-hydroxy-tetrahydrodipicolinate synthase
MAHLLDESARGVYTIAATPFTDAGEVDWASVDSLVDFYLGHGVHGMTILGILGEAHKLSDDESAGLVQRFLRRVDGKIPVIVGVSSPGMRKLAHLSKIAMEAGAAGVMVAPLNGTKTDDAVVGYFGSVVAALGTGIPIALQDHPQVVNTDIGVPALLKILEDHPSIVMLKHEDCPGLRKLSAVRRAFDGKVRRRISILVGNGGLYAPQELRRGADGMMTGFSYPEMLVRTFELFAAGEPEAAEDVFDAYLPLVRHEQQIGVGLAIRKEILRRRGAIASAATRAPGPRLDADDHAELTGLMARLEGRLAGVPQLVR